MHHRSPRAPSASRQPSSVAQNHFNPNCRSSSGHIISLERKLRNLEVPHFGPPDSERHKNSADSSPRRSAALDRRQRKYFIDGLPCSYYSKSEAALAYLSAIYLPNWKPENKKTVHAKIGKGKIDRNMFADYVFENPHDFLLGRRHVGKIIVEIHWPRLPTSPRDKGHCTKGDAKLFLKKLRSLEGEPEKAQAFRESTRIRLLGNYEAARHELLENNPLYRKAKLIVVATPEAFFEKVIARFGVNIPSPEVFVAEFHWLLSQVKVIDFSAAGQEDAKKRRSA